MLTRYCLLDIETAALDNARDYLPKIEAPSNYVKAEVIKAYVDGETMKALDRAGLDPDTCQIICVGFHWWNTAEPATFTVRDTDAEKSLLQIVWDHIRAGGSLIGYGLTWFDAGVLVRRSQILGVPVPAQFYKQGKYRHDLIIELADYLTLNGMIEQKKGRGLDYHCKRLGIAVDDPHSGADVGQLWKDGNVDAIRSHCLCDLQRIRLLAERLGVIQPVQVPAEVF